VLPGGWLLEPDTVVVRQSPATPAVNTVHPAGLKATPTDYSACSPRTRTPLDITQVRGTVAYRHRPVRQMFWFCHYFLTHCFCTFFIDILEPVSQSRFNVYTGEKKPGTPLRVSLKFNILFLILRDTFLTSWALPDFLAFCSKWHTQTKKGLALQPQKLFE